MAGQIIDELNGINLKNELLNLRSKKILEDLSKNSEASINSSCDTWANTIAAYRFFGHKSITDDQILLPHRNSTFERVRQHKVVLSIQDTTELDYTNHPPKNARCLNSKNRFGLSPTHTSLLRRINSH